MNEHLKIIRKIPDGLLDIKPYEITKIIDRPTLIHLKGKKDQPLFISVLVHGNEFSGFIILQKILKKYQGRALPRSLIFFIGNPEAGAKGQRHLSHQPDFNRIWKPSLNHPLAQSVLQYAQDQKVKLGVDIHNNSGKNPLYACINQKGKEALKIAQNFSNNIVYFTQPDSVLSIALADICPAVVIECGLPGTYQGIQRGVHLIETLLDPLDRWKSNNITISHIYYTFAIIRIDKDSVLSFCSPPILKDSHFCFINELEDLNFKKLPVGQFLGKIKNSQKLKLIDKAGRNILTQYFSINQNRLAVKSSFIPSMLTKNQAIARSDCLGYTMNKISIEQFFEGDWEEETAF